ncbi:3-isopropylmalate dehydrogenase [Alicyclobacillus contaminans]|uniref:3-isopropylmalate dehydrogenase n=1 Tax=Alicyclobacillus contaminans TaxID=392016 RepID=UPI0004032B97|nr:3-isopropylmalate dehydrogenase [Alicyclobacillus contaminans]GMA49776.1 3-isopropylmalate dehydrogenase [Alicyclobacillus contaminans]
MKKQICVLPGDGIGPEVTAEAVRLLETIGRHYGHRFDFKYAEIGGAAVDAHGTPLPASTLAACDESDAVLLGAVGGPKWDRETAERRPEAGLLGIRKHLGVYANLRPVKVFPELAGASTLKPEVLQGIDLVIVRELTGGIYFGQPRGRQTCPDGVEVVDTLRYTEQEIERILVRAFEIAKTRRKHVTSVDKANVLESSRLWREIAESVAARYPDVALQHMLVDNAAMQLVKNPAQFDVVVTENLFGDILSDEAAMLTGSIGMLPSASLGNGPGLYEPVHGSAPDIAGKGLANPLATFLSVALMLRYSFQLDREASAVETAVAAVLRQGYRTADLANGGAFVSTSEIGDLVRETIVTGELEHAKNTL